MAKTSGTIDLKSMKKAAQGAVNYITDIDNNGIFVHPSSNNADGVKITTAIEIIKNNISCFKAWIDGEIAKVRVGKEDSGHITIDESGMKVYGGNSNVYELADIGYTDVSSEGEDPFYASYITLGTRTTGTAIGQNSVAFGVDVEASGSSSCAEGIGTKASGNYSHAEGSGTEATGNYSHAEGRKAKATNSYSHAEGINTTASGESSHAGGTGSLAMSNDSFAHGTYATAGGSGCASFGIYNAYGANHLFSVGNGNSSQRKNAFTIGKSGNAYFEGRLMYGDLSNDSAGHAIFETGTATGKITVNKNATNNATISIAKTGYTPWAISGIDISSASCNLYKYYIDGNNLVVYLFNTGASSAASIEVTVTARISYIATSAL